MNNFKGKIEVNDYPPVTGIEFSLAYGLLQKHDVNSPKARLQLSSPTMLFSLHSLPVPVQPGHG